MAQICSLLVAEMKYKFLGTLAGNPPLLYLRRVVMVYQLPQLEALQDTSQQEVPRNVW